MFHRVILATLLLLAGPVSAETIVIPAQTATVLHAQNAVVLPRQIAGDVLRAGAPVPVALSEMLTTKGNRSELGREFSWKLPRT